MHSDWLLYALYGMRRSRPDLSNETVSVMDFSRPDWLAGAPALVDRFLPHWTWRGLCPCPPIPHSLLAEAYVRIIGLLYLVITLIRWKTTARWFLGWLKKGPSLEC